jgi:uncharacterized OsmC-like protein
MTDLVVNKNKGPRDIVVAAEATSIEKWRKQVIAGQPETGRSYAFIADEGDYIPGGEGTAPSPLTYFVSGIALCLLSHVTQIANKKKLSISSEKVSAVVHFHEVGSVLKGDADGFCDSLELTICLNSDENIAEIKQLFILAHRLCFAEKAIKGTVPISVHHEINGVELVI